MACVFSNINASNHLKWVHGAVLLGGVHTEQQSYIKANLAIFILCQKLGTSKLLPFRTPKKYKFAFLRIIKLNYWQWASAGKSDASHGSISVLEKVSIWHKHFTVLCSLVLWSHNTCFGNIMQCYTHWLMTACTRSFSLPWMLASWEWLTLWHNSHHINMEDSNIASK